MKISLIQPGKKNANIHLNGTSRDEATLFVCHHNGIELIDCVKKDKSCYLLHCQVLRKCHLLQNVIDQIMVASDSVLPGQLNAHLRDLEFIGFVS